MPKQPTEKTKGPVRCIGRTVPFFLFCVIASAFFLIGRRRKSDIVFYKDAADV